VAGITNRDAVEDVPIGTEEGDPWTVREIARVSHDSSELIRNSQTVCVWMLNIGILAVVKAADIICES
jgi:hypothetical protein